MAQKQFSDDIIGFAELRRNHAEVVEALNRIADGVVQSPRRSDDQDIDEVIIRVITVKAAGTAVQGSDMPVPTGFSTVIRQRRHSGSHTGFLAFSENAIANPNERSEMADNESFGASISNMDQIWVDAGSVPTTGLLFEVIVER